VADPETQLAASLHAPVSGTVIAIEARPNPYFGGEATPAIVIENDGRDLPDDSLVPAPDFATQSPQSIRDKILRAGISGQGGAMFPTAAKMAAAAATGCRTVLLNGAECEPYITCDDALMRERAHDIVFGAQIILQACEAPRCLIAIEQDKPQALQALMQAVCAVADSRIEVQAVATFYPAGGECQLIAALFGDEVPSARMPADIGILCQNVGTAAAIARLFQTGEPLMSRIVTVTGGAVAQPANVEARIGTSFAALIAQCGGYLGTPDRLIMGGAMMGLALPHDGMPMLKGTNCVVAATGGEIDVRPLEMPCIRCGDCAEVCPAYLLPQQLYWYARKNDNEALQRFGLGDCIECGCCDYVCPSKISLASRFARAKRRLSEVAPSVAAGS
jgi:electron transport complex protein RnfC